MSRTTWRVKQLSKMLGMPKLDTDYLPIHVILELKEKVSKVKNLGALILYGSIVRGEASSKSDIDVMAVPLKNERLKPLESRIRKLLSDVERKFNPKASFSLFMYRGDEDSNFIWEVVNDGAVIYSNPSFFIRDLKDLSPHALISYSYPHLNNTDKKKLQRFLFTSKKGILVNKKNRLEYVSPGVLLLDMARASQLKSFLDDLKVKYSFIKIWR